MDTVAAVRLIADGDTLKGELVWTAEVEYTYQTMAVHNGRLYTGANAIDIDSGRAVVDFEKPDRESTRWMVAVADGRLFMLTGGQGAGDTGPKPNVNVFDIQSGKKLSANTLYEPREPRLDKRHIAVAGLGARSELFSYSGVFTFARDCILIRSKDYLYCFGE